MSLDNIALPPVVLQDLYKNILVDVGTKKATPAKEKIPGISFLGNNQKSIAIIATDENSIYLPDEELNFLMGILNACKLSMADVALVNFSKSGPISYSEIEAQLKAEKIFLFGINPSQIQLPLEFPPYQVQKFSNQIYLSAPSLSIISADKVEKTKLWNCLKSIFSI